MHARESSVQSVMDSDSGYQSSAIKGRLPFINFHLFHPAEIQKIETWDYEDSSKMIDFDAIQAWRSVP